MKTVARSALGLVLIGVALLWLGVMPSGFTFPPGWSLGNGGIGVRDDDGRRRVELKVRQRPRNGDVLISYIVDGGDSHPTWLRGDTWRRQVWVRNSVTLYAAQETRISLLECWINDPLTGQTLTHDVLNQHDGSVRCAVRS